MRYSNYIYIFIMAAVTYAIRALPLTLIRKPIKNRFLQSFLHYVPYVTLAVMTFPAILTATQSPVAGGRRAGGRNCGGLAGSRTAAGGRGLLRSSICAGAFFSAEASSISDLSSAQYKAGAETFLI